MSWDIWNIKRRLLIGGPILIVLGLVLYAVRGVEVTLIISVFGIVVLIAGIVYKPRQRAPKADNDTN